MSHPHLPVLFEAMYDGERHIGFGRPEGGARQTLYRVQDGQVAAAFIATDGSEEALRSALTEGAETVVVTAGEPETRLLPPLLPTATGHALLSGFMGTHKKKWGVSVWRGCLRCPSASVRGRGLRRCRGPEGGRRPR
ncbi:MULTISPECIES: hypothetical protein [unclassified Streptomyces]|uniref:hypothetical protein n=1 Tax=unclassified Streptomyces TaxID=2593676 RepID=UPI00073C3F8D|nr:MULTISPECIES: hypothetical protein [unclassified Streptomyces]ODA74050.1 hypothetical protein APS67_001596 [Streptomyces sp. AVP053U2]